jgi:hypothetical protein
MTRKTQTQISAFVSIGTKHRLERYVEAHGVKKAAVVESALLHHLQALEELPADIVIPPRLVVSRESFEAILTQMESPGEPTEAMKALFKGADPGAGGSGRSKGLPRAAEPRLSAPGSKESKPGRADH